MTATPRDASAGFEQLLDYRRALLERLEQQPAAFAARVAAIPAEAWTTPRDPQGRSILQVAAHLRDVERVVYLPWVHRILTEVNPELTAEASHEAASAVFDPAEAMTDILARWSETRAELVGRLRPLRQVDWTRTGFYPPAGKRTVQWWAEKVYGHAVQHMSGV